MARRLGVARRVRSNGFFHDLYRATVSEWREIVGPKVARRFARLARAYEKLAQRIDRDYAIGRFKGIEEKEVRAERLLEEMDGLRHEYEFADAQHEGEAEAEVSNVVQELATTYHQPDRFVTREDWISNMRDTIVSAAKAWDRPRPTDQQVLEIARDAANHWRSLRERYLVARKRKGSA